MVEQFGGEAQREGVRHGGFVDAFIAAQEPDDLRRPDLLGAGFAQLALKLAQRDDAAMWGLTARAVDFQVADDNVRLAFDAEVNERVRHEHADRIKHVSAAFAVGHDQ